MADADINPFGEHESRPDKPMGESIPLTPVGGGSTWEPEREQETSFGVISQRTRLMKDYVKDLYKKLSENIDETPEEFHFYYFKLEDGELYYRGNRKSLMYGGGKLKSFKEIKKILGKNRLRNLGVFDDKVTAEQDLMLHRVEEDLPSASDVAKADDIELQEITENATKGTEDRITQFEGEEMSKMRELLGLDKQLGSIRGSLKVEVEKRFSWKKASRKKSASLRNYESILENTTMAFEKTS